MGWLEHSGHLVAAAAFAVLTGTACSSSGGDASAAHDTDSGGGGGPSDDAGSGSAKVACSEPAASRPPASSCVKTVTGSLVEDATSAPLALLTTVCGAGLCLFARPSPTGFAVDVNRFVDLDAFVVHVDGRPNHANVFVRLTRQASDAVVLGSPIRVPRLDAVGPELPESPPAAPVTARAGDVTLTLVAGTTVELEFADAALLAEGRKLRSGPVSSALAGDPQVVGLHALAPFGAALKPAAEVAITLPAGHGITDGNVVDVVVLESRLDDPQTGKLRVVGAATVTGGVARSEPGNGLTRLTWVGVRRRGS